jgi:hypothetical protein
MPLHAFYCHYPGGRGMPRLCTSSVRLFDRDCFVVPPQTGLLAKTVEKRATGQSPLHFTSGYAFLRMTFAGRCCSKYRGCGRSSTKGTALRAPTVRTFCYHPCPYGLILMMARRARLAVHPHSYLSPRPLSRLSPAHGGRESKKERTLIMGEEPGSKPLLLSGSGTAPPAYST